LTWAQIETKWPEVRNHAYTAASLYRPEGGETFDRVVERVRSFLDEVRTLPDERVLIVTHAGVLHAVLAVLSESLEGVDPLGASFSTAGLSRIAMEENRARLITLNDVTHLYSTG
jgi:broad specificity phosphatase PhoE